MSRWKGSPVLRLLSDLVLRPFNGRGLGVGDGSIDDFPPERCLGNDFCITKYILINRYALCCQ